MSEYIEVVSEDEIVEELADSLEALEEVVIEEIEGEMIGVGEVVAGAIAGLYISAKIKDGEPPSLAKQKQMANKIDEILLKEMKGYVDKIHELIRKFMHDNVYKNVKNINKMFKNSDKIDEKAMNRNEIEKLSKEIEGRLWSGGSLKEYVTGWVTSLHGDIKRGVMTMMQKGENIANVVDLAKGKISKFIGYIKGTLRTRAVEDYNWTQKLYVERFGAKKAKGMAYRFTAVLDKRTTAICRGLHGKIVEFDNIAIGTNAPPMHTGCRSTLVPMIAANQNPVK